jgi:hypothetical protein
MSAIYQAARSNTNDISIAGALKSLLHQAFGIKDCDGESRDNSLGQGEATILEMDIYLDEGVVIYSDNGRGMSKPELENACVLHKTSEASDTKQGLYGIGLKALIINFTKLENSSTIYSKTESDDAPRKVIQDWPSFIKTDTYVNRAMDEISSKSEQEWNTHAVDPSHGTVLIINCAPDIIKELFEAITSNEIVNSLVYHLGWTYRKSLNKGVKMNIKINGQLYKGIEAVDPLEWDNSEDKTRTVLDVYVNNDSQEDVRVYFTNECSQEYGYLDNSKKKCGDFITEDPPENFTRVTSMEYRSVYNEPSRWTELQKHAFDHIDYKHPVTKNGKPKKYQGTYKHMGGRYYTRNDKTIYRVPTEKKKDGDKDKYKFHDDSRHELGFNCQADKLISILLNKSKLDEAKINKSVIHTMKFLDNTFSKSLAKKYCNKNDNKDTDDSSSDEEIEICAPRNDVRSVPPPPAVSSNHEEDDHRFEDASAPAPSVSDSDSGDEPEAVVENINLELVKTALVDNSTVEDNFDHAYDLEQEGESSSGEETDSDSATTRDVGPSEHLRYSAKGGKSYLNKWFESGEHSPELDTLVEELIQKYKTTMSQADAKEVFSYMPREFKFKWVMDLIADKYPIDIDDMRGGCEAYRAYHQAFPHE